MSASTWKALFGAAAQSCGQLPIESTGPVKSLNIAVRVFTRKGYPLLIIPVHSRLPSETAFSLYAPQTPLARFARRLWQFSIRFGVAPSSYDDTLQIDPNAPFVQFLASIVSSLECSSPSAIPKPSNREPLAFTLLLGNPKAPAPRFLVQLFDASKRPVTVVKAGIGAAAAELINREAEFLTELRSKRLSIPPTHLGIPQVLGRFSKGELHAFSMAYIEGKSPTAFQAGGIVPILNSWLHKDRKVRIADLPAWKRLSAATAEEPVFRLIEPRLAPLYVRPALFHGDFVPWNIKVSPRDGSWTVLDWERSEIEGPPGWDWFHYVLQTAILIEKKRGKALLYIIEKLMSDDQYTLYAKTAGILEHGRSWLFAHLLYTGRVLRPTEGSQSIDSLLAILKKNV